MAKIFAGSTPKFLMKLKTKDGIQLDPSDANVVVDVQVIIYNAITGIVITRMYLNTLPAGTDTWRKMLIKTMATGDKRVQFYLTAAETTAAKGNTNVIQVKTTVVDTEITGNVRTIIKKGKFQEILASKV